MTSTLLFAGGGTGGHIFPLVAVAQAMRSLRDDVQVIFVGTSRGMESRILGNLGERLELLDILPIKGGGVKGAAKGVFRAMRSLPAADRLLASLRPHAVLSIGGYAAGPISLAARWRKVPLALLEPNSVLGLTNLLVAPFAHRAYLAFHEAERWFRQSQVRRTGVPLREGFEPRAYEPQPGTFRILVLGGSQGAVTLNRNIPSAIGLCKSRIPSTITVVHQSGKDRVNEVEQAYEKVGALENTQVVPFIEDVPAALTQADLVIQRAGASALAETCAIGRPSLLIPYPFAAADHQLRNARALEEHGAAICIPSDDANPELLSDHLVKLENDVERRKRMAKAALAHGKPQASLTIAQDLLSLVEET
jgi:UDP-N-acetylglucosamine--N-acetylmuramyl-(pentapeptide) pyrophosphoryl-undecaprenol N-acetylglucosamine transferase